MKKVGGIILVSFIILIIIFNSDGYQEKYYTKRVKELEADLVAADKSMKVYYKVLKSAEKSAQKDYNELLLFLLNRYPNGSKDSLRAIAQKVISDKVLAHLARLEKAIDKNNESRRNLHETEERLSQIKKSKGKSYVLGN